MSTYNQNFKLDGDDINLIERALLEKIRAMARGPSSGATAANRESVGAINALDELLERLQGQQDVFLLKIKDMEMIEQAVHDRIGVLSRAVMSGAPGAGRPYGKKIKALEELLGKLHNQKVWYGQVHPTGVPLG